MPNFLHNLITESAEKHPDSICFADASTAFSYEQLEQQSAQLANLLIENGLRSGDRVAVFMPRGIANAVAVYGVLKSGGIVVPIDPALTARPIRNILDNCRSEFILTSPSKARVLRDLIRESGQIRCVIGATDAILDGPSAQIQVLPWSAAGQFDASSVMPISGRITPESPAYIMYSSGSTGIPKGITHSHRSGLAYAKHSVASYAVCENDVIANHSPLNFDMSTFGFFSSCMAGAKTLIIPAAYSKTPTSLLELCSKHEITIWYSVPLALVQMLECGTLPSTDLSSLRWVLYGGEPFPAHALRQVMSILPQSRFSNVYGPAEVNQCTYYHIPADFVNRTETQVPIGKCWDGAEGLILGEDDEIIADDRAGELVVASETTMLGYWGREDLDAQAYYIDLSEDEAKQYYRTGDWVQRDADGNMLFLGRRDRQIKIRGYRVELDAIERELEELPAVQESCVFWVARGCEKEIHAQVVVDTDSPVVAEELIRELRNRLSPYAIPTQLETVSSLPRNANGKYDRVALRRRTELSEMSQAESGSVV